MSEKESQDTCSGNSEAEKYEMVPPEGGWGYLVCIGLSVIFVSSLCFIYYYYLKNYL